MRKLSEIMKLPISELSDEEICKAAHHRLKTKMTMLVYVGDDRTVQIFYRYTSKIGKAYWSRISTPLMKLWDKVSVEFNKRFDNQFSQIQD